MSEPRDCRCPYCYCPIATRAKDGVCEACRVYEHIGHLRERVPEWRRRAIAHELPHKEVYH